MTDVELAVELLREDAELWSRMGCPYTASERRRAANLLEMNHKSCATETKR